MKKENSKIKLSPIVWKPDLKEIVSVEKKVGDEFIISRGGKSIKRNSKNFVWLEVDVDFKNKRFGEMRVCGFGGNVKVYGNVGKNKKNMKKKRKLKKTGKENK